MKVFWSWQSDTPGRTGRFFIRQALQEVVEGLLEEASLQEPERDSVFSNVHLDQDRQGVPGSPDLARLILGKIDDSAVVVADVTAVGVLQGIGQPAKKLINSNVAIELGYSLARIGDSYVLMVMNEHHGSRDDLPFDLRAKAGPLIFNLAPDASKSTIADELKTLKATLRVALRVCLRARHDESEQRRIAGTSPNAVGSKDWERLAEIIKASCSNVSADCNYQSDTKVTSWTLRNAYGGTCASHLARAGAMLLRSPKVRSSLGDALLSEGDHLTRWLMLLQQRGCCSNYLQGWSDMPDGTKVIFIHASVQDLSMHSQRACLDLANAEF